MITIGGFVGYAADKQLPGSYLEATGMQPSRRRHAAAVRDALQDGPFRQHINMLDMSKGAA